MIDKEFFTDLERTLNDYAMDEERYRNTYIIGEGHPPEAFIILALRCMNFMGEGNLNIIIGRSSRDSSLIEGEVKIDFFPHAVKVYFGKNQNININQKMKQYMLSLKTEEHIGKLDYTKEWVNLGFCRHCRKKAKTLHPDYEHTYICDSCLKLRNQFLVVVQ